MVAVVWDDLELGDVRVVSGMHAGLVLAEQGRFRNVQVCG